MARAVRDLAQSTYALATTGVAGPDPVAGVRAGTAFVAVCGPGIERAVALDLPGDRDRVRALVVVHALDLLRRTLLE